MWVLNNETKSNVDEISRVFLQTAGRWKGCDWPTQFGKTRLNLEGLKSAQATLMAKATAGLEAADWRRGANWLAQVEEDVKKAEAEGELAADLAACGQLRQSLAHAQQACAIESQYHSQPGWQRLCDAIKAAWVASHRGGPRKEVLPGQRGNKARVGPIYP